MQVNFRPVFFPHHQLASKNLYFPEKTSLQSRLKSKNTSYLAVGSNFSQLWTIWFSAGFPVGCQYCFCVCRYTSSFTKQHFRAARPSVPLWIYLPQRSLRNVGGNYLETLCWQNHLCLLQNPLPLYFKIDTNITFIELQGLSKNTFSQQIEEGFRFLFAKGAAMPTIKDVRYRQQIFANSRIMQLHHRKIATQLCRNWRGNDHITPIASPLPAQPIRNWTMAQRVRINFSWEPYSLMS